MNEYLRLKGLVDVPIAVRAGTQNDGIGRADHAWISPPGGLWFTFDLKIAESIPSFALFIGFCLHHSLINLFHPLAGKLKIKWTNDLIYDEHKLGGILCRYQQSRNTYTVGIGINTNNAIDPQMGKFGAISLADILQAEVSNTFLFNSLMESIERHSRELNDNLGYLTYCNDNLFGKGRLAKMEIGGLIIHAEVMGIDESGALTIRKEMGEYISMDTGTILEFIS